MIKRIGLLMVAALMAAMMMVATAAPAFAGVKSDCDPPSTWIQETKTCQDPLGSSSNTRDTDYSNAGGGGSSTTSVNNPAQP